MMVAACLLAASPAFAEAVSARIGESSWGQAWVYRTHAGCRAALPRHVIEVNGVLRQPLLRSRTGREGVGSSAIIPDDALDLAIVEVTGDLANPCGSPANLGPSRLEFALADLREAQLEYFAVGEFATVAVEKVRSTDKLLVVRPRRTADRLQQSMSGSTVVDDEGGPLGMVVRVDPRRNQALALRFDVIKAAAMTAKAPAAGRGRNASQGDWRVVSWRGDSVDADSGPTGTLEGRTWLVAGKAAELVVEAPETRVFRSVRVDPPSGPADGAGTRGQIGTLSVYTRTSVDGTWILARVCRNASEASVFECATAPREVIQVRLGFGAAGGDTLAVGPVSIDAQAVGKGQ
jgi:hypothetical protein